jgi:hypothetical protein|tara:strand:- start:141 stop:350 length:210 start_codon:yes stop_codon:yes gene_type:complete
MSIENTRNIINALDKGDSVEAEKEFKSALSDKVGAELDAKRKDLAGTFLTKQPEAQEDGDNAEPVEIDN